jgi:hypothetical protein
MLYIQRLIFPPEYGAAFIIEHCAIQRILKWQHVVFLER